MTPNDIIAGAFRSGRHMVHRFVDDLTPDEWRHQPVPGANSAAWIVGHLALVARRIAAARLGVPEADLPAVDEEAAKPFAATRQAAGDQSGLGDPRRWLTLFDECTEKCIGAVLRVPAADLAAPAPTPAPGILAPNSTAGDLLNLLAGHHVAMHVGQLTTIRRSLGKPPAA
jgi:uncharacterized damage-inducible protein DinB